MENQKTNIAVPINSEKKQNNISRTFEILIEEMHEEDNGNIRWRPVMVDPRLGGDGHVYITVNSLEELNEQQQWYKQAGQRFKIIREVTTQNKKSPEQNTNISIEKKQENNKQININNSNIENKQKSIPKIITIGDIQIKYDGDSVYQRQWVRLSPKEENDIRIVSDTNNKLISMKNKHFEVKKWVKIEGGSVLDDVSD